MELVNIRNYTVCGLRYARTLRRSNSVICRGGGGASAGAAAASDDGAGGEGSASASNPKVVVR